MLGGNCLRLAQQRRRVQAANYVALGQGARLHPHADRQHVRGRARAFTLRWRKLEHHRLGEVDRWRSLRKIAKAGPLTCRCRTPGKCRPHWTARPGIACYPAWLAAERGCGTTHSPSSRDGPWLSSPAQSPKDQRSDQLPPASASGLRFPISSRRSPVLPTEASGLRDRLANRRLKTSTAR